jgi:hypothetical protein
LFCRLTGVGRGTSRMAWYRGGTVKSVAGDIQYKVTFRAINKLHSIIRRHWFKWLYLLEYCADINKFGVGYNTWQLDEVTRWLHAFVYELLSHCVSNLRSPWHSQCWYCFNWSDKILLLSHGVQNRGTWTYPNLTCPKSHVRHLFIYYSFNIPSSTRFFKIFSRFFFVFHCVLCAVLIL